MSPQLSKDTTAVVYNDSKLSSPTSSSTPSSHPYPHRHSSSAPKHPFVPSPSLWSTPDCSLRGLIMSSHSLTSLDPQSLSISGSQSLSQSTQSQSKLQRDGSNHLSANHEDCDTEDNGNAPSANHDQNKAQAVSSSSPQRSANSSAGWKKPIKSAMRHTTRKNHHPSKFMPSGMMGGTILMPSGGGVHANTAQGGPPSASCNPTVSVSVNGYISPQWGWYISTTPPTPEYHQSAHAASISAPTGTGVSLPSHMMNPQASHGHAHTDPFIKQQWNPTTAPIQESAPVSSSLSSSQHRYHHPHPKPVFTKGAPNYSSGWPTVPL